MEKNTENGARISTSEAALILGVSAPLIHSLIGKGILNGNTSSLTRESLDRLGSQLEEAPGTRAQVVISLLQK